MSQEHAVIIRGDRQVAIENLETNFAVAVRQRELLEAYIKDRLKADKHFYLIGEGENRKPSLTKEGAELICLPHVLKPYYDILSGPDSPPPDDSTAYQITVRCELRRNGQPEGQGLGSASSHVTKKDGTRVVRQKDPGLRHNATLKMACKSAYIAATLNATAASEFFTQDLEDGAEHQEEVETSEHWCAVHKTKFFKRGKMTHYGHLIGDTGKWCQEKDVKPEPPTQAEAGPGSAPVPAETPPPPAASPAKQPTARKPGDIKTFADLRKAGAEDFKMSGAAILKEAGFGSWDDVNETPWEMYVKIAATRGQ